MLLQRNAKCYEEKSYHYQSIIVWKWNHLFTKNYFRKKKNTLLLQIYTQWLSNHLWFNGQQKLAGSGLNWNPCVKVGMSSLFINLILKIPHYFHMKALNERISKWAHLSFYHKQFLRYLYLKFKKEVISLGKFSPLMKFQKVETKSLIFSKLLFKYIVI